MGSEALRSYVEELLHPYSPYYSNGVLNSEGMTLLRVIAREVLASHPYMRARFAKARRLRDYEHVSTLMRDVLAMIKRTTSLAPLGRVKFKNLLLFLFRMPSSGQFLENGGRGPTSPAIPGGGIKEVKHTNRRTNVVRLLPNGFQERKLRRLADISAKLFNEVNYERRQQFFRGEKVDFEGTWGKCYEKYKEELGVNAQAVMQKNNEAWNSFFSLLKLRKENKLPPHMNHISPPKYWKDKETGGRKPLLVIRQDRYVVDEQKLVLKDFGLEINFAGRLRWYGKQGRLEIYYDEVGNAWYASIPVEVGVEKTKNGRRSKHIVRGERKSIQVKSPKGSKMA
ncbi:MAG: transposase, partial [Thermocladium sp.]